MKRPANSSAPHPQKKASMKTSYDPRPTYTTVGQNPDSGYESLLEVIEPGSIVAADGSPTTDWALFETGLRNAAVEAGHSIEFVDFRDAYPSWDELVSLTTDPSFDDPYFIKLYEGSIADLVTDLPDVSKPDNQSTTIVYGPGAALVLDIDQVWYVDLPKRYCLTFIGERPAVLGRADDQHADFKRMVFVDWPAVDRHRAELIGRLDRFIDLLDPSSPTHLDGNTVRASIESLATRPFRTVPHFMPGAWGGQWMKDAFNVHPDAKNLAWSYELIAPEAGVLMGPSAEMAAEIPLDLILETAPTEVMGAEVTAAFGTSFPIRFDYLDTMDGTALSLHCHPRPDYMKDVFGYPYTQLETYYMMATSPESFVYLGLKNETDVDEFESATRRAEEDDVAFEITDYINTFPAETHDLLVIPDGTPHASGPGNVVLEISATPYFYSLRFYDHLRKDEKGNARPIHIDHAFANLARDRRGTAVEDLVARPQVVRSGEGSEEELLMNRDDMFFEILRSRFEQRFDDNTKGRFHLLTLVEGAAIDVTTQDTSHILNYGETILIPAATGDYQLTNRATDGNQAMVVKAQVGDVEPMEHMG